MSDWQSLDHELEAWAQAGQVATLWWRDDDAVEPSGALDRLLALAEDFDWPVALAVIPGRAAPSLPQRLAVTDAKVAVLQHGYLHRNWAPPTSKKVELGPERPAAAVLEDLARGGALMSALFADGLAPDRNTVPTLPVLVPPWNRIDPNLVPSLAGLGFAGLSGFGPRDHREPARGIVQSNTQVDVLRWTEPRGFLGEAACLTALLDHLKARRLGIVDPLEPTGIMTHHLVHDEAAWSFMAQLLSQLSRQTAVRPLGAEDVFAAPEAPARDDGA